MDEKQLRRDIELLLSFAPATEVDEVVEGLSAMFYITGTYEGDRHLAEMVSEIKTRYGINSQK